MKLWLLLPNLEEIGDKTNPWKPFYDKVHGHVVRAETEEEARQLAESMSGDESRKAGKVWLDAKYTTCVELTADGPAEHVLRDYSAS